MHRLQIAFALRCVVRSVAALCDPLLWLHRLEGAPAGQPHRRRPLLRQNERRAAGALKLLRAATGSQALPRAAGREIGGEAGKLAVEVDAGIVMVASFRV
jgi:hypothetical protein